MTQEETKIYREVVAHMIGYTDEKNHTGNDLFDMGYADTPQWIDAVKVLPDNYLWTIKKAAKRVDAHYSTSFHADILEFLNEAPEIVTLRDKMIDKYTKRLENLKVNQANEENARPGGLNDHEVKEYEGLIRLTAEVIAELRTLPNI